MEHVSVNAPGKPKITTFLPRVRSSTLNSSVRIAAADRAGRERLLRYCARPPFALDRVRELDSEHLIYAPPKRGPGAGLILIPLELVDQIVAPVLPPRVHGHRYLAVLARTAVSEKIPRQHETVGVGRSATVEPKLQGLDRRRPLIDPNPTFRVS